MRFSARWLAGLTALILVFALVRLAACFGDLWLDEVWAIDLVAGADSLAGVLAIRLENHLLHSAYVYLVGGAGPEWLYRLPAWLGGLASLVLAGLIAARQVERSSAGSDRREAALLAIVLVGSSYLLVHFCSEARGYGPALGFGLLAYYALLRGADSPGKLWESVYVGALVLGLLAHPIVVHVLLGGVAWTAVHTWRRRGEARLVAWEVVRWHALPAAFLAFLYLGHLRYLWSGGGSDLSGLTLLGRMSAYSLGLPVGSGFAAFVVGAALLAIAVAALARRGDDLWVFHLTAVVLSPLAVSLFRGGLLYERYYVVSTALGLLLLADLLAWTWATRGRAGRTVCVVFLLAFVVGGAVHTARLLAYGRGPTKPALRFIASYSDAEVIGVGGDHDFRVKTMLRFHGPREVWFKAFVFQPGGLWPPEGPPWVLRHRFHGTPAAPARFRDERGNEYALVKSYPYAALSGWEWHVYRNASNPPRGPSPPSGP